MKNFNLGVFILLFLISFYLVIKWLPNGYIIAGGDVGIPVLNPQKQLSEVLSSWWESHGTGITSPITFTAVPFYAILSVFDIIGINGDIIQKGLFFLILLCGSTSTYFLALGFNFNKWIALISSLFYIFNLTTLSVWHRGVHNGMLFLLLAPLSLLVLNWGVKNTSYLSIVLINIISFLLSYVFGALGFVFSLWLLWMIYLLTMLIYSWQDKYKRRFLIIFFPLLVLSWIGTNIWWIFHLLQSGNFVLGQFTQEELRGRGSDVLVALKAYHEANVILRGINKYSHYITKDWGDIYLNPLFIVLSWIPTLIIFSSTLFKDNYKNIYWKFLIILTAVVFTLSKGVNSPLGLLNAWPYDLFPFIAPLRNPYEKIGILLIIPFSILFAFGFYQIHTYLRNRRLYFLNTVNILMIFFSLSVLVWPLWLGEIFVSEGRKYLVSIPSYYEQANNWLKTRINEDDSRVLHLPLSQGESIDYDWGYTGIEPSQYFFDGSSLGYQIGVPAVDSRIRDVLISIHNQDSSSFQKAIASLNIGWIVVHNEINWRPRALEPIEKINHWLSQKPIFIEHQTDFGPLAIYRVKDEYRLGHFYTEGRLIKINKSDQFHSFKIWDDLEKLNDGFLTEVQNQHEELLSKFIEKRVIFPKSTFNYTHISLPSSEISVNNLTRINYPENILGFLNQNDRVIECFSRGGKRLQEATSLARQFKYKEARVFLINYKEQLTNCTKISKETLYTYLNSAFTREEILRQLIKQKFLLQNEFNNPETQQEKIIIKQLLAEFIASLGFSSKFESKVQNGGERIIVFDYIIDEEGDYLLKIDNPENGLIKTPPKVVQVNDQSVEFSPNQVNEKVIQYPVTYFNKGFNEVHLQVERGKNLIEKSLITKKQNPDMGFKFQSSELNETESDFPKEFGFVGEAIDNPVSLLFDVPNLDIDRNFELIFDLYLYQGELPLITITYNTDIIDSSGNFRPSIVRQIDASTAQSQTTRFNFNPPLNASSAKIAFILLANKSYQGISTRALIKNIRVESGYKDDLVLEKADSASIQKLGNATLSWDKTSPTSYTVRFNKQQQPYILVFSETYHPLWQITDLEGRKIDLSHFSVNGFANGWLIEKPLPDKINVKFELQNTLKVGGLIAVTVFLSSAIILIYLDLRKRLR